MHGCAFCIFECIIVISHLMIVLTVSCLCKLIYIIGAVEYKLFVGSLNKQATVKEVEEVCFLLQSNFTLETLIFSGTVFLLLSCTRETLAQGD